MSDNTIASQNSLILQAGQAVYLKDIIINTTLTVFSIDVYDRNNYAGNETYDYGKMYINGAWVDCSNQRYEFEKHNDGHYYETTSGADFNTIVFKASDQEDRLTNFQFGSGDILYNLACVTHSINNTDTTPNITSGKEIAQMCQKYLGAVWDDAGCWVLASNIAVSTGASLSLQSGWASAYNPNNGQYKTIYNGYTDTIQSDWQYKLKPGDVVSSKWKQGLAHIMTVDKVVNGQAYVVDNISNIETLPGKDAHDVVVQ